MKTIVVPTDYSPTSENAMFCAAQLALSIEANIFLLHVYELPVSMNDVPVLMVPAEELQKNAEIGMSKTKDLLQKNFPSLNITAETRLGDFLYELKDVCETADPFGVVIGNHEKEGLDRLLFGNTALAIIRNIKVPVIIIPDAIQKLELKNILFAIDGFATKEQLQKIKIFAEEIKGQLHIIHVQVEDKEKIINVPEMLADLHSVYQTVKDADFLHGIETYIAGNEIDLLMLMPHKHNFIERIFSKTHTAEAVEKLKIPIVTLAAD